MISSQESGVSDVLWLELKGSLIKKETLFTADRRRWTQTRYSADFAEYHSVKSCGLVPLNCIINVIYFDYIF